MCKPVHPLGPALRSRLEEMRLPFDALVRDASEDYYPPHIVGTFLHVPSHVESLCKVLSLFDHLPRYLDNHGVKATKGAELDFFRLTVEQSGYQLPEIHLDWIGSVIGTPVYGRVKIESSPLVLGFTLLKHPLLGNYWVPNVRNLTPYGWLLDERSSGNKYQEGGWDTRTMFHHTYYAPKGFDLRAFLLETARKEKG